VGLVGQSLKETFVKLRAGQGIVAHADQRTKAAVPDAINSVRCGEKVGSTTVA
jgi:hypothetical protein